jgi:hypothetical protein
MLTFLATEGGGIFQSKGAMFKETKSIVRNNVPESHKVHKFHSIILIYLIFYLFQSI